MGERSETQGNSNNATIKACTAMVCIAILEGFALYKGVNGVALAAAVATIAGIGGFVVGRKA